MSVSLRLALLFYFTHFLPPLHLKFVDNLRIPLNESMDLSDEFLISTRSVAAGSPSMEILEQVKKSADADCGRQMMRKGHFAMKNGSWEDFKETHRKNDSRLSGPSEEFVKLARKWQEMKLDDRVLCRKFTGRAWTFCGGSSRRSVEWEV